MRDRLLLDLDDGAGTQALAATCYGQAVRDCRRVGENLYILEVRPDLRVPLYRQLREHYRVHRLFRFTGGPESCLAFTGEVYVHFLATASREARDLATRDVLVRPAGDTPLDDGFFMLAGGLREDPVRASIEMEKHTAVSVASPAIWILPPEIPQEAERVTLTS